jgi:RimJ/RimL family protein N-acetyltransferase
MRLAVDRSPIGTRRLSLAVLDAGCVDALAAGRRATTPFVVPTWWPDDEARVALLLLQERREAFAGHEAWRPRAMVDRAGVMVGHAGFHLPPRHLAMALADPSFAGVIDDGAAGAVEIGYTVFPSSRGRGLATEAVTALTESAFVTRDVEAVVATVSPENRASLRVLHHVGGFRQVGTCQDEAGRRELVFVGRPGGLPHVCTGSCGRTAPS